MEDITAVFDDCIRQYGAIDIAESEFKKMIHEDSELYRAYRDYCDIVGSSEKCGFTDYAEEYLRTQNDVWESLSDYDDDRF